MKRLILAAALTAFLPLSGCIKHTSTTTTGVTAPTLPKGSADAVDAAAYQALATAHAFDQHINADFHSGAITLNQPQTNALLALNRALNKADNALISYHCTLVPADTNCANKGVTTGTTTSQVQAAIAAVTSAMSAVMDQFIQNGVK
jgi:hypothetical protein